MKYLNNVEFEKANKWMEELDDGQEISDGDHKDLLEELGMVLS